MINQGTHGHRLFVSRDAALRIFQLVDDTFEDFSHLVADLETRLKLVFEEILAVPRSGKLIDSSFPGLRAAMVHLSEPSRAALFYLVDDTKVVLTSYVDEHYQDDLQGVFVELGLLPR